MLNRLITAPILALTLLSGCATVADRKQGRQPVWTSSVNLKGYVRQCDSVTTGYSQNYNIGGGGYSQNYDIGGSDSAAILISDVNPAISSWPCAAATYNFKTRNNRLASQPPTTNRLKMLVK